MSYDVTYGESQTYPAAWRDCRGGGKLYLSQSARLSPKIKRAIVEDVLPESESVIPASEIDKYWDLLPMSKWENVTVRPLSVVNVDDPSDFKVSTDYTHTRGCGDMETERVAVIR